MITESIDFFNRMATEPEFPEKFWVTKEGNHIPLSKIEDKHLENIINLIHRACRFYEERRWDEIDQLVFMVGTLQGEMATYYAERDLHAKLMERSWEPEDLVPGDSLRLSYKELIDEARKRGFTVKKYNFYKLERTEAPKT